MSGSLRELLKAIESALEEAVLPADGQKVQFSELLAANIRAYLDKHDKVDVFDGQRLHEELLTAYRKHVLAADSAQESLFIQLVSEFVSCITPYSEGLKFWIDEFMIPAIDSAGRIRSTVDEAQAFLLRVMVYDVHDTSPNFKIYEALSEYCADSLVRVYLGIKKIIVIAPQISDVLNGDLAERQVICMQNAESESRKFGSKRPIAFFNILDRYLVQTEYRVAVLNLLCTFVQAQPPHLFETHNTSLVEHLYDCLLLDRSALAVNLACTIFVMLLSHICSILGPDLPKIFAIYARLIYWDILFKTRLSESDSDYEQFAGETRSTADNSPYSRMSRNNSSGMVYGGYNYYGIGDDNDLSKTTVMAATKPKSKEDTDQWQVLDGAFDASASVEPDSTAVNYAHLYTFVYGMYPIHFLTFLTSPRRYFRIRDVDISAYIDFDIDDIAQRSQDLSMRHLLHPNFFRYTFESEITDKQRWDLAGSAEDIAAFCITLDTKHLEMPDISEPTVIFRGFHDQLENSLSENQPTYLSLDESTSNGYGETSREYGATGDSYLYPNGDALSFGVHANKSVSPYQQPLADKFIKNLTNDDSGPELDSVSSNEQARTPMAASISSLAASDTQSVTVPGGRRRPMVDIESILDTHKDINSRALSRRGSLEHSPQLTRQKDGSITESLISLSSPISRVNSAAVKDTSVDVLGEHKSDAMPSPSLRSYTMSSSVAGSPVTSRQNQKSPTAFMQLSHSHMANSTMKMTPETESSQIQVQFSVPHLQRQLLVLRNELNFERYLKQLRLSNLQRLSHQQSILQRDEANRQGLVLTNRILKAKIVRLQTDAKKEHANLSNLAADRAKYSNQLLQKNRDLKNERDRWKAEEESVCGALDASRHEVAALKQAFLEKEAEIELLSRRLKDATTTATEVESLRSKYSVLQSCVLDMYAKDDHKNGPVAEENQKLGARIAQLEMRLKTSEMETRELKKEVAGRIEELEEELSEFRIRGGTVERKGV
ncbi:Hamartin protein-domain-containing protein [Lipomyces arxii]|uniref:Hamartin protein-domain-containing protein n=1 Tax=Lipomyces arxii TaxID=56418 RepID=UPI0034CF6E6A